MTAAIVREARLLERRPSRTKWKHLDMIGTVNCLSMVRCWSAMRRAFSLKESLSLLKVLHGEHWLCNREGAGGRDAVEKGSLRTDWRLQLISR